MAQIRSADLASPGFKADPFPFHARLRAEAPVYRTRWTFLRLPAWIVTRYDDVLTVPFRVLAIDFRGRFLSEP